jgi:hypothetical protein
MTLNPDEMCFEEPREVDAKVARVTQRVFHLPPKEPGPLAQEVVDKFTKEASAEVDALADDPLDESLDEFGPLEYTELCPQLAASLKSVRDRLKKLKGIEEALTAEVKRLGEVDKKREEKKWSVQLGVRCLTFQKREGALKVDEEKFYLTYIEETYGPDACNEAKLELSREKAKVKDGNGQSPYVSKGKDSVSLEVL